MKQQEDKQKLSADGAGSGRKASAGRPRAANSRCGGKANGITLSAEGEVVLAEAVYDSECMGGLRAPGFVF